MELGVLKPLLATLAMPPLSLLLLALLGLLLIYKKKRAMWGMAMITLALVLLWFLSCHGVAVWLSRTALPQFEPMQVPHLKTARVQAIVILGGGLLPQAPEYGQPQPGAPTAARLRYGVWLARQSGLPLAFTGGIGWAANGASQASEADVAKYMASQDYGVTLRWLEGQSRDTHENARLLGPMLQHDGIKRIALVTDARHMPRAAAAFERTGFEVTPAPLGFMFAEQKDVIEWLPSAYGLMASQQILREWLAWTTTRWVSGAFF